MSKPPAVLLDLVGCNYLTGSCPNMIVTLHDSPTKLEPFCEITAEIMTMHVMCVRLDYALKTKMLMESGRLTPEYVNTIIAALNAEINTLADRIGPKMQLVEITRDPTRVIN